MSPHYDVAIVGASIAGCTAATLYGRAGLSVALIEKHSDPAAYKTACTHYMQASGSPTVARLGLDEKLEAAGGVRNAIDAWSEYGWIRPQLSASYPHARHGWTIRRETLDPILREHAASTDGVELMLGHTVTRAIEEAGRVAGVVARDRDGGEREIRARLVVAADGRGSKVSDLAGIPVKKKPHERFFYWAYYRIERPPEDRASAWFMNPDCAYVFPSDGDVALIGAMPIKAKLADWKRDPETRLEELYARLPDAPRIDRSQRTSRMFGKVDLTNVSRPAVAKGMALTGDAAIAADPVWGIGCGWAFQSAEWLADATVPALRGRHGLDAALARYRRRHRRQLTLHAFLINDYSTGRKFNPLERLSMKAAARDAALAERFHAFGARSIQPHQFFSPRWTARMLRVAARRDGNPRPDPLPAA